MPTPVTAWSSFTPVTAKSLDLSLYTSDGSSDNPTGIAFLAYRPLFFGSYTRTTTFPGSSGGTQAAMPTSGSITSCNVVLDSAGYYGQASDLPGKGYYQFTSVIGGSAGDGVTPGGWMLLSHVVPLVHTATQTSVSADLQAVGGNTTAGSRQAPNSTNDSAPFFCDLINVGASTWQPAVTIRDSGGLSTTNAVSADSSGETPRFYAVWAAVSATTNGQATFTANGTYSFTAPAGVTSVTAAPIGAGAGAGAGNVSAGGVEFGGGGGGGGESASGAVAVTPGNNYPVIVGAAGAGGASPGGGGAAGGNSSFAGDSVTVTAHGGSGGGGATTAADGGGGAGGTGSAASTHHNGGAGATGGTGSYGGGGGSSAGSGAGGNAGTGPAGGTAPVGGGPGGTGGSVVIKVVQQAAHSVSDSNDMTLNFASAVQAGNGVIACIAAQGSHTSAEPVVKLSNGTALNEDVSADHSGGTGGADLQTGVYSAFGVTGGQTGITVHTDGQFNRVISAQIYEVTGMGTSPNVDNSGSNTNSAQVTWQVSRATAAAPDLWIGSVGAQNLNAPFDIGVDSGNGWNSSIGQNGLGINNVFLRLRSAYQVQAVTGQMKYAGSFSTSASFGVSAVAYTASVTTPGGAPVIGPGGGGGAGLGTSNGAGGLDGAVALTWTGISGSGYGTPPLPAPYANWGPTTTIGTSATSPTVDINSPAGITNAVNFLSNAPVFRIAATTAQSIANAAASPVQVTFSGAGTTVDSYAGWSTGTGTYTVQRAGLYLFHGLVAFTANATGTRQAGANINSKTYWGPGYKAALSGNTHATKTQVFSLNAGDTVQLTCRQDSGGALTLATNAATRFFLMWLGTPGVPAAQLAPPDTTFRWSAGTPGADVPALLQTHLGNDLGFLANPPYLMACQTTTQSGLAVGSFSTVVLDSATGIVHSDPGDSYGGWTPGASNLYTAQVAGWYLVTAEVMTASSAAAGATVVAGIALSTSGGGSPAHTPDQFQRMSATSTASVGGGATALGLYYLLAGETIALQVEGLSFSGAYSTLTGASNGGTFASHLEILWVSS